MKQEIKNLEEKTEQEISKLSRKENFLNIARHLPLLYLPISAIMKPMLIYNQNPIDYYAESPEKIAMAVTGLTLAVTGTFLKGLNDNSCKIAVSRGFYKRRTSYPFNQLKY